MSDTVIGKIEFSPNDGSLSVNLDQFSAELRAELRARLSPEIDALIAENERLRAGLTRIAEGYGGDVGSFAKGLLDPRSIGRHGYHD